MKCDCRLEDGRRLDHLKKRGEPVALHDLPEQPLHISWCDVKRDGGNKRFYVAATFKAGGAYLAKCYRQRRLTESFFKSVKHDFGELGPTGRALPVPAERSESEDPDGYSLLNFPCLFSL